MNKSINNFKKLNPQMKKKLAGLFFAVVLALVALCARIIYINVRSGEDYSRIVLAQAQHRYSSKVLPYRRGDILDCKGMRLAYSEKIYNVILDCKVVNYSEDYREPTIKALTEIFGIDRDDLEDRLDGADTRDSMYQIVKKGVNADTKQKFEDYCNAEEDRESRQNVQGVWFEESYIRVYPFDKLACDLIGFPTDDESGGWGIEGYYNSTLSGVNGRQFGYFNDSSNVEQTIIDAVDGNSIVSTIDLEIQRIVEDKLNKYIKGVTENTNRDEDAAKDIGIILMDPQNGEVLAMASSKAYNLNNPRDLTDFYTEHEINTMSDKQRSDNLSELWQNFCITASYEPGSVVKPLNMAAALDAGVVTEDDAFYCDGLQRVGDCDIKCAATTGHGEQNLSEIIQNSCNDGMMQIASRMKQELFLKYMSVFNFGKPTGIDLPAEGTGVLHAKGSFNDVELATASFGQGYNCTMIQEISAMNSIANGGFYYRAHVAKQIVAPGGKVLKNYDKTLEKQIISEETSQLVKDYMEASCLYGTSRCSKVSGYSMCGKTGTSQKLPRGNGKYLVSFIGFAPKEVPKVSIYVVIDEPKGNCGKDDSRLPQYLAREILTEVFQYIKIPKDEDEDLVQYSPEYLMGLPQFVIDSYDASGDSSGLSNSYRDAVADTSVPDPLNSSTGVVNNDQTSDGMTNEEVSWLD